MRQCRDDGDKATMRRTLYRIFVLIFTALTAVSLLLFLAAVVNGLWMVYFILQVRQDGEAIIGIDPVPYVGWTLAYAVLPAAWGGFWLRERRAARRVAQRLCLSCGYDLRASPGRCPECGEPVAGARQGNHSGVGNF